MWDLEDKVVVLSGAAGAIGRVVASGMAAAGARLVLADRDGAGLEALADSLRDDGARAVETVCHDAASSADAETVAGLAASRFGAIDVLVPGAGVYPTDGFATMSDAAWRQCMAVNLDGVFYLCRAAVPRLASGSSIVFIASIAAYHGSPDHAHYAAAKGGLSALGRTLAKELAPRIRVNTVAPGPIESPMVQPLMAARGDQVLAATPLGRLGRPEEVADAVLFLASARASFITGTTLHVNGGLYLDG